MKHQISLTALMSAAVVALAACNSESISPTGQYGELAYRDNSSTIESPLFTAKRYVGNLEFVLGDVKQALITNKLDTAAKVDNVLKGFKDMGVNGIRIPIYPENYNPNQAMFDYFHSQAKAQGFKIMANPAQGSGGQRIANGSLTGAQLIPREMPGSEQTLINVVGAFAQKYESDWVNPFNEDGRPDTLWSTAQINEIYKSLYNNVNGADLVGPGVWGIPASIEVLRDTEISNYISIATTHNLGFNHSYWDEFFTEAGDLPVWDSEANNSLIASSNTTRVDAALAAGVDGIVLYNSWNTIDLSTGELKSGGQVLKDKVVQYYFIQNRATGKNIKPFDNSASSSLMVQVPSYWTGDFSAWELIPTSGGYFQFRNKGAKYYFRPSNSNDYANIATVNSFSGNGWHTQWKIEDATDGYLFIKNRATSKKIRSRNSEDISTSNDANVIKINQAPNSWTGDMTQWSLIPATN